ncbi:AraC family transcriptional regulator [Pediococcus pentosaceus]|uniref:AraC family transcriptional regulator n=1 Tax=Pediococcus pentosaceus TaxID=1255 RepID=UPI000853DE73|nr:AraC family transcriptional regulator [Pediococcus pentosaceus]MDE3750832.1 helix-turn-helix transcriptional regulator [Pediococcus pentosaceus]
MRYSFGITDYSLPLYIDSLSNNWEQEDVERKKGYPYVHWLQSIKGSGMIYIDDKEIELKEGEGILIDRDIQHAYHALGTKWVTAYFTFGGELITEMLATLSIKKFVKIEEPDQELKTFVDLCYRDIQRNHVDIYQTTVMVYKLLVLIKKNQIKNKFDVRLTEEIIDPIVEFIKEEYRNDLKNEDFVRQTNYSLQYILGVFNECLNSSPRKLLTDYRVRKAKELLITKLDLTVEDIGKEVGFNTNSYFIKVFKQRERMTPGRFRESIL